MSVVSAQMSYSKALKIDPERAVKTLEAEVQVLLSKELFDPVNESDIPASEKEFIRPGLSVHKDKYYPDGNYIKSKNRVLANGKLQKPEFTTESSSPVARIESIFMLAAIAAFHKLITFKIDVVCGYPNAVRPEEVLYKYLRLDRNVSKVLVKIRPEFVKYLLRNDTMVVELKKMLYGMKESGYYFHQLMEGMYEKNGFTVNDADVCVIHKFSGNGNTHGAYNVDDCLFGVTTPKAKAEVLMMYEKQFGKGGFTVSEEYAFDMVGMMLKFDPSLGQVAISQRDFAKRLLEEVGITKFARTPCDEELFIVPTDSPLLTDEEKERYRSWVQSLMYAATRTYPECLPAATVCHCFI